MFQQNCRADGANIQRNDFRAAHHECGGAGLVLIPNGTGSIVDEAQPYFVPFCSAPIFHFQTIKSIGISFAFDILCLLAGSSWTFCYCYYATTTSNMVADISAQLYHSHWIVYPRELQFYVMMGIARAQNEVFFTGFKIVRCTLQTFGKVRRICDR